MFWSLLISCPQKHFLYVAPKADNSECSVKESQLCCLKKFLSPRFAILVFTQEKKCFQSQKKKNVLTASAQIGVRNTCMEESYFAFLKDWLTGQCWVAKQVQGRADTCAPLQLSLLSSPTFPLPLVSLFTDVTSVPLCAEQCTQTCGNFFILYQCHERGVLYQPVKHGKCFIFVQTESELSCHHLIQQFIHRHGMQHHGRLYIYSRFSFLNSIIPMVSAAYTHFPFQLLMAVTNI